MLLALTPRRVFARFRPAGLAALRRLPFPALALAACLLFAAFGAAALDDYGVTWDEPAQRRLTEQNAAYIMGDRDALPKDHDRFYGIAFELPLLLAERLLGLEDSRDIYLLRHLLTHFFFIIGGFCCGLLAWRMFNNRWLALLAMLLFLLHPRLYAHSFFNSKDIPFAVMFVIALYLTHRAFRRDTAGAFALLGIVVGLAVNMRPFALLFIPAVLALRGLDLGQVPGARRRILLTAGSFAAATLLAMYAGHPNYWESPLLFIEGLQTLSQHPEWGRYLFQGQIVQSDALPVVYIPVWFGITAPPAALLLGAAGIAAILWRGFRAPARVLRNGKLRFLFLLLACFALPLPVVIVLQSHLYHDWRNMYFLWGPFCLLAVAGLRYLFQPGRGPALTPRIALYGLAVAGLGGSVYAIVSLHPHQQIYFNLLVNRAASSELERQYVMDYWKLSYFSALEYLLERYPDTTLYIDRGTGVYLNQAMIPAAERDRIVLTADPFTMDFHIGIERDKRNRAMPSGPALYQWRAYGSVYLSAIAPRLVWGAGPSPGAADYRAVYRRVTAAAGPAAQSDFDVYLHDGALYYVKENCGPEDTAPRVFLNLYPVKNDDLPDYRRESGFDDRGFEFGWRGGFFDGKCITQQPLPDYDLAWLRTGQQTSGRETLWQAEINPSVFGRFQEIEKGLAGWPPAARGDFDLYWDGGMLVYRRESCAAADVGARFYLHLFPEEVNDLPAGRRGYGFVNRGFDFPEYGAIRGGKCLAAVPLPDYDLARIRTGQYSVGNKHWQVELAGETLKRLAASEAIAVYSGQEPAARSEWNVYIGGGNRLVYLKESCGAADMEAKFYLHIIPQDMADLPGERREIGFENRDFWFEHRGAALAGRCAATVPLPDYPIARIRTGQYAPGVGPLWRADFPASPPGSPKPAGR